MKIKWFVILVSMLGAMLTLPTFAEDSEDFQIVIHPGNPIKQIERASLANLFLKKTKFWENGNPAVPVDLTLTSATRKHFSTEILDRPAGAVANYWQLMIF